MDYRMYSGCIKKDENVVTKILKDLKDQGIQCGNFLKFVGFEGEKGTKFHLNSHRESTEIPSNGKFITPYAGDRYMSIYSLVFEQDFKGHIYYII